MARQQTLEQRRAEQPGALARLAQVGAARSGATRAPRAAPRLVSGRRAFAGARPTATLRERIAAALALFAAVGVTGGEGRVWT